MEQDKGQTHAEINIYFEIVFSMKAKTICIDIDGTLAHSIKNWLEILEKERGISKNVEELNKYKIEEILGLEREEVLEIFRKAWSKYDEIEVIGNAPEVISRLHSKYTINIMTGSVAKDGELKAWLEINKIPYDNFVHLQKESEKLEINGDIFVEDNPDIALSLSKKGKKVILIERPWNKSYKNNGIEFAKDWGEVEKIIEKQDM
ncbi:MAG: 5' nucleotidase, NT5C type [Candidatus Micrarchaeia archaeon]|jgi:uncharacterized HAD superfamily protein